MGKLTLSESITGHIFITNWYKKFQLNTNSHNLWEKRVSRPQCVRMHIGLLIKVLSSCLFGSSHKFCTTSGPHYFEGSNVGCINLHGTGENMNTNVEEKFHSLKCQDVYISSQYTADFLLGCRYCGFTAYLQI